MAISTWNNHRSISFKCDLNVKGRMIANVRFAVTNSELECSSVTYTPKYINRDITLYSKVLHITNMCK